MLLVGRSKICFTECRVRALAFLGGAVPRSATVIASLVDPTLVQM